MPVRLHPFIVPHRAQITERARPKTGARETNCGVGLGSRKSAMDQNEHGKRAREKLRLATSDLTFQMSRGKATQANRAAAGAVSGSWQKLVFRGPHE